MRIKEATELSPDFIANAIQGHAKRVEEEGRRGVSFVHRQLHISRMIVLIGVASGRLEAASKKLEPSVTVQRSAVLSGEMI